MLPSCEVYGVILQFVNYPNGLVFIVIHGRMAFDRVGDVDGFSGKHFQCFSISFWSCIQFDFCMILVGSGIIKCTLYSLLKYVILFMFCFYRLQSFLQSFLRL